MTPVRTGGMTTIGILNIIFGSLGTLFSLLAVVGGGLIAAGGAALEAEATADTAGFGTAVAAGGGLIMLIGFVGVVAWLLLIISGVGVLQLKSWGRTLSIICGSFIFLLNAWSFWQAGFGVVTLAGLVYGGLLVGLFFTPEWKAAFSSDAWNVGSLEEPAQDDFRAAA